MQVGQGVRRSWSRDRASHSNRKSTGTRTPVRADSSIERLTASAFTDQNPSAGSGLWPSSTITPPTPPALDPDGRAVLYLAVDLAT